MAVRGTAVQGVRGRLPAGGSLRLRALLRPARGRLRLLRARPRGGAAQDPGRQRRDLALRRLPALRGAPALDPTSLEPGLTPLVRADRLAERLGLGEVWVKNDAANPTHSFKDRVVARRPGEGARARLRRPSPAPPPATSPTPSPRTQPPPGSTPTCSCPPTSRSRSCSPPASTGPSWSASRATTTTSTASAPSCARRAPGRSSTSTCGPTTPRARRRSPTRPSSSSAGRSPTESSARSPRARCSRRSAADSTSGSTSGLVEGELPAFNGAQAAGCSPVATAFAEGWDVCKPQRPETIAKSLAIGNPADGVYALDLARRTGGSIDCGLATTRSATASDCSPRPPASSPRRPAASPSRCWPSSPKRGDIDASERVVASSPARG